MSELKFEVSPDYDRSNKCIMDQDQCVALFGDEFLQKAITIGRSWVMSSEGEEKESPYFVKCIYMSDNEFSNLEEFTGW